MVTTRDVCVLGLGYVGLPLACAAAEAGHRVIGYDPDRVRVAGLRQGRSPVEDVEDRSLEKVTATGGCPSPTTRPISREVTRSSSVSPPR